MARTYLLIAVCFLVAMTSFSVVGKDVTQTEMDISQASSMTKTEEGLKNALQELTEKVSEEGKEKLQKAHQSFLSYRQAECAFETAGTEGGSVHSAVLGECLSFLTKQQIKLYKEQLNCEEGNLSCGGQ